MAVDKLGETKLGIGANGANGTNGAARSNGAATPVVAEGTKRTKRTSSLMRSASSLPKVEHSLEEFIARANQTLVDVTGWGNTDDQAAREEDDKRREQDAQRWKQAEQQMRESQAREASLRRQLDGLQGKLAEAEARVAVALSASGQFPVANPAQDKALDELRSQIEQANQRLKASEDRSSDLARALESAKTEAAARPVVPVDPAGSMVDTAAAEERIRLAEAKAAKALAAARAAAAGLTVSSADLAAIESGLVVPMVEPERRTPWIPIMLAFAGGLGIMFLVWKFALSNKAETPQAQPQTAPVTQPATQPDPTPAPASPTVTPIDESGNAGKPAAAASEDVATPVVTDDVKAKPAPTVTPIDPEPEPEPVKAEPVKAAPVVKAKPEPRVAPKPEPRVTKPAVRKDPPKATKPAIEDPFATPAPKPAPKKAPKPAGGGIVDPF
jgi:hypothetical protein